MTIWTPKYRNGFYIRATCSTATTPTSCVTLGGLGGIASSLYSIVCYHNHHYIVLAQRRYIINEMHLLAWSEPVTQKKKKTSHITEALNWPVRQFTSWNAADSQPQQVFLTSRLVYAPDPPHYTKCTLAGHTAAGVGGVLYHPQQLESSKAVALLDIGRYRVSGIRLVFSFFGGGVRNACRTIP